MFARVQVIFAYLIEEIKSCLENFKNLITIKTRGLLVTVGLYNPDTDLVIILRFVLQRPGEALLLLNKELYLFYHGIFISTSEKALGIILLIVCLGFLAMKIYLFVYDEPEKPEGEEAEAPNNPRNERKETQCNCPSFLRCFNVFRVPTVFEVVGNLLIT